MANYELSNIGYKGNTYIIKDNSALHQDAIGSWTPDFANLKVLATYEYDISSTSYFKICERPNVTNIDDATDVIAFRITVTGTDIHSEADVVVRLQPTANITPRVVMNHRSRSISAGTTGFRYMRCVYPKAANTSYKYEIAIAAYNTTARHVKVEVFKTTSDWTFSSAATVYSYNSTYQTTNDTTAYTSLGLIANYTQYMTVSYANYAGYKSSWDGLFNGQGNFLSAGAAIAANQFVFIGKDNKVYPTTSTAVEIDPAWPIVYCTTAYAANAAVGWSAIRTWGYFTPASSILKDGTLVADDTVYMRCAYVDGKLYSSNTMTQNLTAGNTYIKLGKMYTATAMTVNTYNSEYFTLDTDGHIKALNGYLFNAANASVANAVKRQYYLINSNDYPILFDSNPVSDITTATTIPSITTALKYNPSTGNLSSTLFTGSGAGLTDIPLSSIQGADELLPTKLLHVFYDSENDSYSFTDSLTEREIIDILDAAYDGEINLNVQLSDIDFIQLLKYYYTFNLMLMKVLIFETTPVSGINQTTMANNALPSYFAIAYARVGDPAFQFMVIEGANLETLSQQFMQLLAAKEDLSNKVTSVDSSSTDDQYPSAKLLYDTKNTLSGLIQDVDESAEKTANKVTTVDSSSDDNHYPSAKAVYDAIPSKVEYSNTPFVGTCSTAAGTMAKTVTVDSSFQLVDGVHVRVYMENANTNTAPTLNVNGTGAKSIGIQDPYNTVSNVALSAWYAGAFHRNGWFNFVYAASYNSGNGRWIIEDSPASIRLANFAAARLTTINSSNGTLVNGGVRYTVVANGVTGNPFVGSASVLWLSHDTAATYTRQIALSTNTPPHMAFRSQDSSGGSTWQPWEYVLTAANQYDSHMATMAYTASGVAFSNNALTIPIDGTEYKILQINIFNNDLTYSIGYPRTFIFNAGGTTGCAENTSYYCTTSSAASGITVTFDSSWATSASTSVDITVLYRRIS